MSVLDGKGLTYRLALASPIDDTTSNADIFEKLEGDVFVDIDRTSKVLSAGWASTRNVLDCELEFGETFVDPYLHLCLREDALRIDKKRLKAECRRREKKACDELGRKLFKSEKRAVKQEVDAIFLSKADVSTAAADVIVSPLDGIVRVGRVGEKTMDNVVRRLEKAGFEVKPLSWEFFVLHVMPSATWGTLVQLGSMHNGEVGSKVPLSSIEIGRLGREFLTWLWYQKEANQSLFDTEGEGESVEIAFVKCMRLGGEDGSTAVTHDEPDTTSEARSALSSRLLLEKATIHVQFGEDVSMTGTLSHKFVGVSGLKLAAPSKGEDAVAVNLFQIEKFDAVVRDLFRQFAVLRLDASWSETLTKISAWIQDA